MHTVATDNALRFRLVTCGLERVVRFSWQATAEATLRLYRELLGGDL
jgi:glycosyltransferase involved in cell wall biosynthesis